MIYDSFEELWKYTKNSWCICKNIKTNEKEFPGIILYDEKLGKTIIKGSGKIPNPTIEKPEDWEFKAPPLGYIQIGMNAYFLIRNPIRREWKLGLTKINTSPPEVFNNRSFFSKGLRNLIEKDYINPNFALNFVKKNKNCSFAISKKYAVVNNDNEIKIEYCAKPCGNIDFEKSILKFYSESELYFHESNLRSFNFRNLNFDYFRYFEILKVYDYENDI